MSTIKERVEQARSGTNPLAIARLESGWVVASDAQPLEGYCLLLADPVIGSLNDLSEEKRMKYCRDMARVGDALLKITGAYRINYETWCNLDQALHTHIVPRYRAEADEKRVLPACKAYDFATARKFDPARDRAFIEALRSELTRPRTSESV